MYKSTSIRWLFPCRGLALSFPVVAIVLLLLLDAPVEAFTLPSEELEALHDLFVSTNGQYWDWRTPYLEYGYPWNFNTPQENPCSSSKPWQAVNCSSTCENSPCSIVALQLSNYHLNGTLPF